MDVFDLNSALVKSWTKTIENTPLLEPYEKQEVERVVMKEEPFTITESIERDRAVITAHFLEDYKFSDYSLVMRSKIDTWLHKLLDIQGYKQ